MMNALEFILLIVAVAGSIIVACLCATTYFFNKRAEKIGPFSTEEDMLKHDRALFHPTSASESTEENEDHSKIQESSFWLGGTNNIAKASREKRGKYRPSYQNIASIRVSLDSIPEEYLPNQDNYAQHEPLSAQDKDPFSKYYTSSKTKVLAHAEPPARHFSKYYVTLDHLVPKREIDKDGESSIEDKHIPSDHHISQSYAHHGSNFHIRKEETNSETLHTAPHSHNSMHELLHNHPPLPAESPVDYHLQL